jgi:hypothetical protein
VPPWLVQLLRLPRVRLILREVHKDHVLLSMLGRRFLEPLALYSEGMVPLLDFSFATDGPVFHREA